MALFVHLAATTNIPSIRRSGLKPAKDRPGIYAMPVLPNFVVTHQWLRELRKGGARRLSAVYFRVPDDRVVQFGHYGPNHVEIFAAEAGRQVLLAADPLGLEVIVPGVVRPGELHRIRELRQVIGWRHFPGAHNTRPCGCPACQGRGEMNSRRLREAYERELRQGR